MLSRVCIVVNQPILPYTPHYNDVITSAMASQITSVLIIYSTVCSSADQNKYKGSAPLAFVKGMWHNRLICGSRARLGIPKTTRILWMACANTRKTIRNAHIWSRLLVAFTSIYFWQIRARAMRAHQMPMLANALFACPVPKLGIYFQLPHWNQAGTNW